MGCISNAHVNSSPYYELIINEVYNAVLILCHDVHSVMDMF